MEETVIVGLDLSLNGTGICVIKVNKYNIKIIKEIYIDNKKVSSKDRGKKLWNIYCNIDDVISEILERGVTPTVVMETGFSKHNKATQALYSVVGVVELVLFCNGLGIKKGYAPTTIKKTITGNGRATKEEVATEARQYLVSSQADFVFQSEDTSDALAVALAYAIENLSI